MTDINSRLDRCFASVFSQLSPDELRSLSARTNPVWDSMATVALVGLIEEQFNVEIPPEEVPNLLSYSEIAAFLAQRNHDHQNEKG